MMKKVLLWIAVIIWMILIFAFSAQPASDSDALSGGIAEKIVQFILNIQKIPAFSKIDAEFVGNFVMHANHYIRKTAHFMIFAVLGVLVYGLMAAYNIRRRKTIIFSALVCLLYAASDEIHQVFVPGRAGRIGDVLIDFCGSASAIGIRGILKNRHRRVKK